MAREALDSFNCHFPHECGIHYTSSECTRVYHIQVEHYFGRYQGRANTASPSMACICIVGHAIRCRSSPEPKATRQQCYQPREDWQYIWPSTAAAAAAWPASSARSASSPTPRWVPTSASASASAPTIMIYIYTLYYLWPTLGLLGRVQGLKSKAPSLP
jgi:hypothetical protein